MCWVSKLDRARVRLGQDGQSLSERAGPSSGADHVRIQAQMTTLRYRRPSVIEPGRGGVFEFSERTRHFDCDRRRMRSKSLARGSRTREFTAGNPAAVESQKAIQTWVHRTMFREDHGSLDARGSTLTFRQKKSLVGT